MSPPDEKKGGDPTTPKQSQDAAREQWERQKHEDHLRAINALTDQLAANQKSEDAGERDHSFREKVTIALVALTLIATGIADVIFYLTMRDARTAATHAHQDSVDALNAANSDAVAALAGAHSDSAAALKGANAGSAAALAKAAEANETARDTSRRQLRAYVGIVVPGDASKNNLLPPNIPAIRFSIRNSGSTPAYKVTHWTDAKIAPFPLPNTFSFKEPIFTQPQTPITVFPGVLDGLGIEMGANRPLSPNEAKLIETLTDRLYVFGTIQYMDGFNRWHWTNYCVSFNVKPNINGTVDVVHDVCPVHNDTDGG